MGGAQQASIDLLPSPDIEIYEHKRTPKEIPGIAPTHGLKNNDRTHKKEYNESSKSIFILLVKKQKLRGFDAYM